MKATLKSIIVALTVLAVVVGTLLVLDAGNVVGVKKSITAIKVTAVDLSGNSIHNASVTVCGQTFFTDDKGCSPQITPNVLVNCYDGSITDWYTTTIAVTCDGYVPSVVFNAVLFDGQTRRLIVKMYPVDDSELPFVSYVESPPDEYVKKILTDTVIK